jgi:hypothetical protein
MTFIPSPTNSSVAFTFTKDILLQPNELMSSNITRPNPYLINRHLSNDYSIPDYKVTVYVTVEKEGGFGGFIAGAFAVAFKITILL